MARSLRLQFAGACYHVMARGNRREAIFLDDEDRRFFLHTLGQACERTGWLIHAWVLMNNHYHLCLQTPEPNLVAGMAWLQNTLTRRFNTRHRAWGRVFGDRYKAVVVQGEDPHYHGTLLDYIHLNPVRAKLVRPRRSESVLDYPWSSLAGGYALAPGRRAPWLATEAGFEAFGIPDTVGGRRHMVERLDRRAVEEEFANCGVPALPEEVDARCSHLRRGWYWGSQEFEQKLLRMIGRVMTSKRSRAMIGAREARAHGSEQARRWLREGLAAAGLGSGDLPLLKGSDPRKQALARLLWRHTTASQVWIARELHMRSAANVSQQLRRLDERHLWRRLPAALKRFLDAIERT